MLENNDDDAANKDNEYDIHDDTYNEENGDVQEDEIDEDEYDEEVFIDLPIDLSAEESNDISIEEEEENDSYGMPFKISEFTFSYNGQLKDENDISTAHSGPTNSCRAAYQLGLLSFFLYFLEILVFFILYLLVLFYNSNFI